EAARAGGTVLRAGEPDVGHAVEDPLEADAGLGPCQGRARARVHPPAETNVLEGVRTVETELVRLLEPARIPVRGSHHEKDVRPGSDVDVADRRRAAHQAEVRLDRALVAQHLLDERRDHVTLLPEVLL